MTPEEALDHSPLTRGKYNGYTPLEIADLDPAYLVMVYDYSSPRMCSKLLRDECEKSDYNVPKYVDDPRGRI